VSDTGPGIPVVQQERIFEAFQSEETPDGRRGSGLGLAISRQLARALGGDVHVESREGVGSRFVLDVPDRG
jgi:protein-histidine pros-kinase